MAVKRGGLNKGKGLESLFPQKSLKPAQSSDSETKEEKKEVPLDSEEKTDSETKKASEKTVEKDGDKKKNAKKSSDSKGKKKDTSKKAGQDDTENVSRETSVQYVEKLVEVPVEVEKIVEVPVEVEKIVEVPVEVEKIVEVPVEIEKIVEKPTEITVKLSDIVPNKDQPRQEFDEAALNELASSIRQFGIIQPLLVQKKGKYYELIAGERRWRAAKIAGLKEVPVVIRDFTPQESMEISLIENIQRENLNPIEEAVAFKRLINEFDLKQEEVAERVSKSRAAITNSMRLLKLPEAVQQMLIDGKISSGHARALLSIENPAVQQEIAEKIIKENLSVREVEKLVKSYGSTRTRIPRPESPQVAAVYKSIEEKLKGIVGSKVEIRRNKKGNGKIEIEYYSQTELERIIELFESIHD